MQRTAASLASRLKTPARVLEPRRQLGGPLGHAWEQFRLPQMVRGSLLWSPCNTGPLAVSRQVVTMHDAAVFDHPEWFAPNFASLYRFLLPRLARRCLKIVTVSQFSRERLAHWLSLAPERIDVVWNGVDEHFRPAETGAVDRARAQLGLGDAPYFACLSTMEPRKNLSLVLRAWAVARDRMPEQTRLLVIGKKGAAAVFRDSPASSSEPEGVVYAGFVAEALLPPLLTGATALLYPCLYEGFGLPVAEAMACGTPVVTTALASLPEIAGDGAIYVDPLDPGDLARQLVRLVSSADCRAEYSGRGRARAALFSWSEAAARMDAILGPLA